MDSSPTRRRTLQVTGTALIGGVAGCLGDDGRPEETLDFDNIDRINEAMLPDRRPYRTPDASFPTYRRYEADRTDTVLVLLHTAGFDSRLLQPLATAIADANAAHVFTPDLRGHGPDPKTRGDIDYVGRYEDDVRYLIESVDKLYPDANVVVGGHGTGGGIAVRFGASRAGSLADGYLLLAPYLGSNAATTRENLGGWASFSTDRIVMLRVLTGFGIDGYRDMTTVEFDIPEGVWDGTETPTNSYRVMASYTPKKDAVTEMEPVPCFAVVGTADETAHPEAYESVFSTHPNAAVELVEGASHLDLVLGEDALDPIVDWLDDI
jgi:pimeloyl-ACP methyl ester carboxylesterase